MGMFDYIKCEMPLPEPRPSQPCVFQTKDTPDQYMTIYTITADGRLMWRPYDMEIAPKKERPYPNARKGSLLSMAGMLRRIERDPEAIDFHGDIYFSSDFGGEIFEYRARFTEGKCTSIVVPVRPIT